MRTRKRKRSLVNGDYYGVVFGLGLGSAMTVTGRQALVPKSQGKDNCKIKTMMMSSRNNSVVCMRNPQRGQEVVRR